MTTEAHEDSGSPEPDQESATGAAEDAAPRSAPGEGDGAGDEAQGAPEPDPLEAALAESAKLKDQLLRTAADFDNFRKRARRDEAESARKGREDLLRDLLPVFDNLERATAHAGTATDVQSLADGVKMVMRQFEDVLGRLGIERVAGVGSPFDPTVHEAIQQLETDEYAPGSVAAEVQAGYQMGERLIRAAMVVVAKAAPPGSANPGAAGEGTDEDAAPDGGSEAAGENA